MRAVMTGIAPPNSACEPLKPGVGLRYANPTYGTARPLPWMIVSSFDKTRRRNASLFVTSSPAVAAPMDVIR